MSEGDAAIPETINITEAISEEVRSLSQVTVGKVESFARGTSDEFLRLAQSDRRKRGPYIQEFIPEGRIEYHRRRSSEELERGVSTDNIPAAHAHLKLSSLHHQRAREIESLVAPEARPLVTIQ